MLPSAWKRLGPETRALVLHAHLREEGVDAAERLREVLDDPRSASSGSGSRQAQHARLQRLLTGALTSCSLTALADTNNLGGLFQRADFAALRPNSAQTHVRFGSSLQGRQLAGESIDACWTYHAGQFLALAERWRSLDAEGLAVLHASLIPLFGCCILRGPALQDAWRQLWRDLGRSGALDSAGIHAHVAGMGAFVGESGPAFEVNRHAALVRADFCSAVCLARSDSSPELLQAIAANLRGESIAPDDCLYHVRPASTVASLAGYIRGLMRQPGHFYTDGLILTLLRWTSHIGEYVNLRQEDWSRDISRLMRELRSIEECQILEKSRFWHAIESSASAENRRHLIELWSQPATSAPSA